MCVFPGTCMCMCVCVCVVYAEHCPFDRRAEMACVVTWHVWLHGMCGYMDEHAEFISGNE